MKRLFGHLELVADLLRGFIPDARVRGFHPESLVQLPDSRVDGQLRQRYSDTTLRFELESGESVVLIIEVQSTVDPAMAVRMARQTLMHCERHHELNPGGPPPIVLPLVFYTGSGAWRAPRTLWGVSDGEQDGLLTYLNRPCYFLIDARHLPVKSLPEQNLVSLMVRMMMAGEPQGLMDVLDSAKSWLGNRDGGVWSDLYTWARIVLAPFGLPDRDVEPPRSPKELVHMVNENLARRLEEIKQETRAEGLAEGRVEGCYDGQRNLLQRLILLKFGDGTARRCAEKLSGNDENGRMEEIGDLIIACGTGEEFLSRL